MNRVDVVDLVVDLVDVDLDVDLVDVDLVDVDLVDVDLVDVDLERATDDFFRKKIFLKLSFDALDRLYGSVRGGFARTVWNNSF